MTIAQLRREMSTREFAAWVAYDAVQPIGDWRQDFNLALGRYVALIAAGAKDVAMDTLIPVYGPKEPAKEDFGAALLAWAERVGQKG
jgi:hypothetical protein